MTKQSKKNLILTTLLILFPLTASANFEDMGSSARPLGMGNAFSALATDVNALYYNPAGLGYLTTAEATSSYTRYLMGLADDSSLGGGYLALAIPMTDNSAAGIAYNNFNLAGFYQEHTLSLGYGLRVMKNLSVGLTVKGLMATIGQDAYTAIDPLFQQFGYTTTNIAFDLGFIFQPFPFYRVAFTLMNINQPNMALQGEDRVPMIAKLGLAYRSYGLDVVSDVAYQTNTNDLDLYFGAEKWFAGRTFAMRAGLGLGSREDRDASIGASYRADQVQIDYAFVYPLTGLTRTAGTHRMALSIKFGETPVESESDYGIVPMVPKALYEEELEKVKTLAQANQEQLEQVIGQLIAKEEKLAQVEAEAEAKPAAAPAASEDVEDLKAELAANKKQIASLIELQQKSQEHLNALEAEAKKRRDNEAKNLTAVLATLEDQAKVRRDEEAKNLKTVLAALEEQKNLRREEEARAAATLKLLKEQAEKRAADEAAKRANEANKANAAKEVKPVVVTTPKVETPKPIVTAPAAPKVETPKPVTAPKVETPKPTVDAPKAEPAKPQAVVSDARTYTVQAGDTIKSIAKKIYGSEDKWVDLYWYNQDRIKQGIVTPGQVLLLPQKKP